MATVCVLLGRVITE